MHLEGERLNISEIEKYTPPPLRPLISKLSAGIK